MAQPARRGSELRRLAVRQPGRAAGRDPHDERAGGLGPDRGPPATPHTTGGEPSVPAVSTASGSSRPPRVGPITTPTPATADRAPIAWGRSTGGNAALRLENVAGRAAKHSV